MTEKNPGKPSEHHETFFIPDLFMKKCLLGLTAALAAVAALASEVNGPALIPAPRQIKVSGGVFTLNPSAHICVTDSAGPTAEYLAGQLRRATGYPLKIHAAPARDGDILISIIGTNTVPDAEGCELLITPEAIAIKASSAAGAFYGVQSLLQLFPPAVFGKTVAKTNWTVSCVEIEDAPRFPWRGLLLDVSRHFLTVGEVKGFLDLMALHKLNTLHLHLTDDQGWRLEIKKYPELTRVGSIRKESPKPGDRKSGDGKPYGPFFYTQKQIRDLVAYARVRHIDIVPEIDMPGHVLGLLATHPDLSCRGTSLEVRTRWGIADDVLCIGNPHSLVVMEDILDEVVQLFPSRYIHIGGDECPRVRWQECPKCQ
ncbi:MAG TPA: beta-N-acetylhexosaminidase, partial [Verrucomicrobiae bacterium]